jgi:hypothetical protein
MTYVVIVECSVCGRELERSSMAWATREAAQAHVDAVPVAVTVLNAPRCRGPECSGPYADINTGADLRVIEGETAV